MTTHQFTRRTLLRLTAGAAAIAVGCTVPPTPKPMPTVTATQEEISMTATPTPPPPSTATPAPVDLDVKIGQMFMVGFRGLTVATGDAILEDITARHLGSVVFFDYDVPNGEYRRNIASPAQVQALTAALQAAAPTPLLIATDQEGGLVSRLHERYGFPPTLSHAALGALNDPAETYNRTAAMAQTLAAMGINLNLAPDVDLNINPNNPVIGAKERSFGADPQTVTAQAAAFIRAHHDQGVLCTLKHFPGHGSSRADSHNGFVDVSESWSPVELDPYRALIDAGLADSVMTAHVFNRVWDAADPATLAPAAINGLLRTDLGYDGVVISDDIQMGAIREYYTFTDAVRKAILAGVDMIAIANNSIYDEGAMATGVATVKALVEEGVIPVERIEESYRRIMALKARLGQVSQ
jgi:beta-N-acetylhexosaminidase